MAGSPQEHATGVSNAPGQKQEVSIHQSVGLGCVELQA